MHDPASQPAFVMMIANCVREVQTASSNKLSLHSIASLVLDAVHAAVRADWVDLAATVQTEQEADDPSIPDELVDTFRDKASIEGMVSIRATYIIHVLDSGLLGPPVDGIRSAVQSMKRSKLIRTHLAASDAALPLDLNAWKEPWVSCITSLADITSVDDSKILDVITESFPADEHMDDFQELAPESTMVKNERRDADVPNAAAANSFMTFTQICSPPVAVLSSYGTYMSTMTSRAAASPRQAIQHTDIGFARMFVFAARLEALLWEMLDMPGCKRSYDLVAVDIKSAKPIVVHRAALEDSLELPFAGHVRVGAVKGKPAIKVCTFMGLTFYVTPPSSGVMCGGGAWLICLLAYWLIGM